MLLALGQSHAGAGGDNRPFKPSSSILCMAFVEPLVSTTKSTTAEVLGYQIGFLTYKFIY